MSTCSVENCKNECFEQEDKCILHCEKDNWYEIKDNKKDWSKSTDEIKLFWEKIQKDIRGIDYYIPRENDEYQLELSLNELKKYEGVIFPFFQDCKENNYCNFSTCSYEDTNEESSINIFGLNNVEFIECHFLDIADFSQYNVFRPIKFEECHFHKGIPYENHMEFYKCHFYKNDIDLINRTFKFHLFFKDCKNIGKLNLKNSTVNGSASFRGSNFSEVDFEKTTFEDISVFTEATFHNNVNFKYTTFAKLALFRKTDFKKTVNFEDSIFKEEANFLDMTANMANRETARIIKNSFEQQNNIIEANRFYALEMEKREEELDKDIKSGKNIVDWLIFKAHAISSNHSQDSVLPILWILNIALFYSMSISTFYHNNVLAFISALFMMSFLFSKTTLLKIMLLANFLVFYFLSYINSDYLTDKINPFSIMTSKEPINFGLLLFKITIAYLIYQFIVSVRQNTRRK
ncbi:pentapeptide repeat-containing protein [Sulfurimonas sp.]|uniref:pentapeptide repeat-containing protein n=1 Tax=Sulfurimonas sp. TaxID=2022749 RepID=UPI0025F3A483|nr:pentapeptide repeat-containing protein [Sulfurimonas sp.]MBW6488739.1 pentapeptide repeat-containing protein [Sulfurimonas sp.]